MRITDIREVQMDDAKVKQMTAAVLDEAGAGHVAPVVGQVFPLAEAAAAHAAIESRAVFGKTLLAA